MTFRPHPSGARRPRIVINVADIAIAALVAAGGAVIARAILSTALALPTLTGPMPGCC